MRNLALLLYHFICFLIVLQGFPLRPQHAGAEIVNQAFSLAEHTLDVSLLAKVEMDTMYEKRKHGEGSDDFRHMENDAEIEGGIEAALDEYLEGFVVFVWDDEDGFQFDEAFLTLYEIGPLPVFVSAGKLTVPFGAFETNMISDPLTQDMGEALDIALAMGFGVEGIYASAYTFFGDIEKKGDGAEINGFGIAVGYGYEHDDFEVSVGVGWISHIADSEEFEVFIKNEDLRLKKYASGFDMYALLLWGPVSFVAEYITATEDVVFIAEDELQIMDKPKAWHIELGYTLETFGIETTIAVTYQGSNDALDFLPRKLHGGVIQSAITEHLLVAVEYIREKDYNENEGGSGEILHAVTLNLQYAF